MTQSDKFVNQLKQFSKNKWLNTCSNAHKLDITMAWKCVNV